uniref:RCC1 domain-containing protein 1 n=1 Tax=Sphenodon punctatus TaxID=8508 RepID=A0A8D0GEN4_SPHPU
MAGPAPRVWFVFGFRDLAATPVPVPVPAGEGLRAVRPGWSYEGHVTKGSRLLLQGAVCGCLPQDCLDLLPGETHLLLLRAGALEAWAPPAPDLRGDPAWSRPLCPREAAQAVLPLVPGGYVTPRPPFFTPLPPMLQAQKLTLGHDHVVLLSTGGALYTWGSGRHGQLGHGSLECMAEPRLVEALHGVPMGEVAAGGWHSASVSEAGDLYIWGWNRWGQLALPSQALAESKVGATVAGTGSPIKPASHAADEFISIQAFPALLDLPEVSKISCGSSHTAAVTRKYGQLGHTDTTSSDQPQPVAYFPANRLRVEDVVCGPWSTYVCAVEA